MIPVRSPTYPAPPPTTNGGKNNGNKTHNNSTPVPTSKPKTPPPVAPRKNFEAFVMTGDAILNVSKLRNDDQLRSVRNYDYKLMKGKAYYEIRSSLKYLEFSFAFVKRE
jgi:hypothetical protein